MAANGINGEGELELSPKGARARGGLVAVLLVAMVVIGVVAWSLAWNVHSDVAALTRAIIDERQARAVEHQKIGDDIAGALLRLAVAQEAVARAQRVSNYLQSLPLDQRPRLPMPPELLEFYPELKRPGGPR